MSALVLVFNAGSSSLKYALFRGESVIVRDTIERIGISGHDAAVRQVLQAIQSTVGEERLLAVGHRVLHGGRTYQSPVRVTAKVLTDLESLIPLGPLHQPHNLAGIRAVSEQLPTIPQVACFDTAFHATMPIVEQQFGLPRRFFDAGIKRYGFHGLAYQSVVETLRRWGRLPNRLIACHLGNGASLCAIRDGQSVATTMGFTPLDGLLMGTRPGQVDPGVLVYLLRHEGYTPDQLAHLLERESGLLGVSGGISADMRDLLASAEPAAGEAVDLFCFRVVREFGAMVAALQGVDALAFSGGIGEHSAVIRERICQSLGWLGVSLDPASNHAHAYQLHGPGANIAIYRVPADEESVIAKQTRQLTIDASSTDGSIDRG